MHLIYRILQYILYARMQVSRTFASQVNGDGPFVHPMAITSLFAQSKDQQHVSSSSMRNSGSDSLTTTR